MRRQKRQDGRSSDHSVGGEGGPQGKEKMNSGAAWPTAPPYKSTSRYCMIYYESIPEAYLHVAILSTTLISCHLWLKNRILGVKPCGSAHGFPCQGGLRSIFSFLTLGGLYSFVGNLGVQQGRKEEAREEGTGDEEYLGMMHWNCCLDESPHLASRHAQRSDNKHEYDMIWLATRSSSKIYKRTRATSVMRNKHLASCVTTLS